MKKLFLILLLLVLALAYFIPQAHAKVWTKELVDKVTLESGYKFSICTIDMPYDRTNAADNVFNTTEKDFEANPDAFPCNKQSIEDVLFADITLHFNKTQGGGSIPQKLIEFQNHLYSVDQYGDVLADPNGKTDIKDIAAFDWFSTIPTIHGVRGTTLTNTDPAAVEGQKTLPNSNFLIIHDSTGKFSTALFVFNNKVYKFSSMISQVTIPATLVDYTQSEVTTPDQTATWKTYENSQYGYSIKYPLNWTITDAREVTIKANDEYPRVQGDVEPISYWVNINYVLNPQKSDFKTVSTKDLPQNLKDAFTYTTEAINGITAYRTTSLPSMSGCEWVYFQNTQMNFAALNFCLYDKTKPFTHQAEHYSDFNTMLSTFKFTQ